MDQLPYSSGSTHWVPRFQYASLHISDGHSFLLLLHLSWSPEETPTWSLYSILFPSFSRGLKLWSRSFRSYSSYSWRRWTVNLPSFSKDSSTIMRWRASMMNAPSRYTRSTIWTNRCKVEAIGKGEYHNRNYWIMNLKACCLTLLKSSLKSPSEDSRNSLFLKSLARISCLTNMGTRGRQWENWWSAKGLALQSMNSSLYFAIFASSGTHW